MFDFETIVKLENCKWEKQGAGLFSVSIKERLENLDT